MRSFLAISAAMLLCACGEHHAPADFVKSVYTTTAESTSDNTSSTFTGVVEENDNISLGFKTPGQISKIYVKEGQHVQQGQLLATLDDADYKLGVEALQIQYDQLTDEVARAKRLFEKKSMSANDFEKANAGLRQLAVQLQVNKNKLEYTRLYAPASGIVESINFSPAEMVDAGTSVMNILSGGSLKVLCDIPATTYRQRDRFKSFTCTSAHDADTAIALHLIGIVPKADSNQLYRMRFTAEGSSAKSLTPGMNVEVHIAMTGESDRLAVPASAIFKKDGTTCVWVLSPDSTVTAKAVELEGTVKADKTIVTQGLSTDDIIIRAGVSMLHEGEKVRVIEKPSETNAGGLL